MIAGRQRRHRHLPAPTSASTHAHDPGEWDWEWERECGYAVEAWSGGGAHKLFAVCLAVKVRRPFRDLMAVRLQPDCIGHAQLERDLPRPKTRYLTYLGPYLIYIP